MKVALMLEIFGRNGRYKYYFHPVDEAVAFLPIGVAIKVKEDDPGIMFWSERIEYRLEENIVFITVTPGNHTSASDRELIAEYLSESGWLTREEYVRRYVPDVDALPK